MTTVDTASSDPPFKDHFSRHSSTYAEYRPTYPGSLFSFLADCCGQRELAWDCATGNGQAARALTPFFEKVIATDASQAQLEAAEGGPEIDYRIAPAEKSGLDAESIDLITVAQALHWFDIPGFFDETQRVLAPGGVLAAWCYERCQIDSGCDELINELSENIVGPYWPPERKLVDEGYESIELPMPAISSPEFVMKANWNVDAMLGYLLTWSSSQRYLKDRGSSPVKLIEGRLRSFWGDDHREVIWPLHLKIGRVL